MECSVPNCTNPATSLWGTDHLCLDHYRTAVADFNESQVLTEDTGFFDIADIEEDRRIDVIGRLVMEKRKNAAFVTDSDPGKADRYIRKLTERFPGIRVLARFDGPVANSVTVKVGPPA